MCGILGVVTDNKISVKEFKLALDKVRHRGPDDEGYLIVDGKDIFQCSGPDTVELLKYQFTSISKVYTRRPSLLLGHRRLAIIDLTPLAHQPMEYENGNIWIVYNGEIYNYIELRNSLQKEGFIFKSNSDTEVILASYLKWGYECVHKFNGMWSFCIWDKKKNVLFCARDRFGVKPFYYFFDGKTFAFASEIKALIELPFVKINSNSESIIAYLYFGIHDFGKETFFYGINQLMPGYFLIFKIDTKKLEIKKYYEVQFNPSMEPYNYTKAKLYSSEFFALFEDAIKLRLRSDVPVGVCLSGGLDSSSIICMINHLLKVMPDYRLITGKSLKSFTCDFNNFSLSEKKYVNKILSSIDAKGYFVYPNAKGLQQDIKDLIYYQEEPFGSLSIYAQYCVMRLAKNIGVKVLLDGQGGDELLAGYIDKHIPVFLASLLSKGKISDFFTTIRYFFNLHYLIKTMFLFLPQKLQFAYLVSTNKRYFTQSPKNKKNIDYIAKEFTKSSLNENLINEIKIRLPRLLKYEDRNSMRFSIESRLPFLDYRLVEFLMNLPAFYKIHRGYTKWLLRVSMEGIMPEEIRIRKDKVGFAVPQRDLIEKMFIFWKQEILENKFISNFLKEYVAINKIARDYEVLVKREQQAKRNSILWRIINLGLWWKTFFN